MSNVPTHQNFVDAYAGEAPWDIGRPQKALVGIAHRVAGPLLDVGCGTGDAALFFGGRGLDVTGIDYLEEPIRRAKAKAAERGLSVTFRVESALDLAKSNERFASVLDCGLFHVFSDDDRVRYVRGLAHVLQPGGQVFLMCFSDAESGDFGPRRISREELMNAFADGWQIESIQPTQFETNPKFTGATFSPGGPKAWLAIVRRK